MRRTTASTDVAPFGVRTLDLLILGLLVIDGFVTAILEIFFLLIWVGSVPLPITALCAGVTNLLLVRAAAAYTHRPLVAGLPLAGWLIVFVIAGLGGPGGDVVLPLGWRTVLLLVVGVVPAALHLRNSTRLPLAGA